VKKALDITMTRALPEDFDAVLEVVQDSTRRMQENGLTQWRLYLTDAGVARVRRRVEGAAGEEVYLVHSATHDRPIGAVSIEWSDREYWAERGDDGLAGYIHMLCVHRIARGTGLGERIVRRAEELIASRGRTFARIDCWAASPFLPAYYERLGYERRGVQGGPNGALLMEKRL
jgi:protein-tyrosine phosphatase